MSRMKPVDNITEATLPAQIVVDGPQRLHDAKNHAQVRKALLVEVAQRHAVERAGASLWRRFWIDVKVQREVRRELQKQFPPGALHLVRVEPSR